VQQPLLTRLKGVITISGLVWELENAKAKVAQAEYHLNDYVSWERIKDQAKDPDNYVSGELGDHYNRYEEDFDLLEKMNMNAYRFSIEWSRIEPEEGLWDAEAVTHYKEYVARLKKKNIEPIVTTLSFYAASLVCSKGWFYETIERQVFHSFHRKNY